MVIIDGREAIATDPAALWAQPPDARAVHVISLPQGVQPLDYRGDGLVRVGRDKWTFPANRRMAETGIVTAPLKRPAMLVYGGSVTE